MAIPINIKEITVFVIVTFSFSRIGCKKIDSANANSANPQQKTDNPLNAFLKGIFFNIITSL